MAQIKIFAALLLSLLALVLTVQNINPVHINLLFWSLDLSPALLLLFSYLAGLISGLLVAATWKTKRPHRTSPANPN
ncbi:MAG: hypothetical protein Tsb0017_10220 [Geothermobacteraceae bacterium]